MIRLIELFAGIGAQAAALKRLGVKFEHWRAIDNDRFSVASYNAVHGTSFEPTDITKVKGSDLGIADTHMHTYIVTYSHPCQDLSVAGLGKGCDEGSGTRSALLWEVKRLLNECDELPQILVMENVPQVHSKSNIDNFNKWLEFLSDKGYTNYWKDLNAKDYGVAQSRNRCFCVSLLGEHEPYVFEEPIPLTKKMKDYLEPSVDDRFYVTSDRAKCLIDNLVADNRIPGL